MYFPSQFQADVTPQGQKASRLKGYLIAEFHPNSQPRPFFTDFPLRFIIQSALRCTLPKMA
jgi:hypothetical protein